MWDWKVLWPRGYRTLPAHRWTPTTTAQLTKHFRQPECEQVHFKHWMNTHDLLIPMALRLSVVSLLGLSFQPSKIPPSKGISEWGWRSKSAECLAQPKGQVLPGEHLALRLYRNPNSSHITSFSDVAEEHLRLTSKPEEFGKRASNRTVIW